MANSDRQVQLFAKHLFVDIGRRYDPGRHVGQDAHFATKFAQAFYCLPNLLAMVLLNRGLIEESGPPPPKQALPVECVCTAIVHSAKGHKFNSGHLRVKGLEEFLEGGALDM